MQVLEQLVKEAQDLSRPSLVLADSEREVARQLQICNACRYCESFCAVFPAMTRRLSFEQSDIHYMANLCPNCGSCLHACQYAEPHDFAVNIPRSMAQVRLKTYETYAWPAFMGVTYAKNGLWLALCLFASLALFIGLLLPAPTQEVSNFYGLMSHETMVSWFAPVFLFDVLALSIGVYNFLSNITPATSGAALTRPAALEATHNIMSLKYLDGGHHEGCNNEDDTFTLWRQRMHHFTFYGFLLCFASTSVATLYHYLLGEHAPYAWGTWPKVLGVVGGMSLLLGTLGLGWLNLKRHPWHGDLKQKPMDLGFIALLALCASTGLLLWVSHGSTFLPSMLAAHLASIMALFLTLPYGKFAHGIYRSAALIRFSVEKRQATGLVLKED